MVIAQRWSPYIWTSYSRKQSGLFLEKAFTFLAVLIFACSLNYFSFPGPTACYMRYLSIFKPAIIQVKHGDSLSVIPIIRTIMHPQISQF